MELKNNEFMSDWLREHTPKEPAKEILHEYDNSFKIYTLSDFKCCDNPIVSVTDDGNKHQCCENCGYEVLEGIVTKQGKNGCCNNPRIAQSNDYGKHKCCANCGWSMRQ